MITEDYFSFKKKCMRILPVYRKTVPYQRCPYEDVRLHYGITSALTLLSPFTHVASSHANLLEQKKVFTKENNSTPLRLLLDTNVATISML